MSKNISWMALTLAALAVASQAGAGEFGAKQKGLWLCQNNQASPTATLYASELFEANAARDEVSAAFKKMLAGKYQVTSGVSCSMAFNSPGIAEKLKADNLRWFKQLRASGAKVVETGWKFAADDQGSATAPTSPSVAGATPAALPPKTYQCWLNSYGNNYITPSFTSSTEYYKLNADWRAFITKAHPPSGPAQVACMEMDPKQAASNLAQAERKRVDWKE
jgi:hypothetical protein